MNEDELLQILMRSHQQREQSTFFISVPLVSLSELWHTEFQTSGAESKYLQPAHVNTEFDLPPDTIWLNRSANAVIDNPL